jgi:hypothetical protein
MRRFKRLLTRNSATFGLLCILLALPSCRSESGARSQVAANAHQAEPSRSQKELSDPKLLKNSVTEPAPPTDAYVRASTVVRAAVISADIANHAFAVAARPRKNEKPANMMSKSAILNALSHQRIGSIGSPRSARPKRWRKPHVDRRTTITFETRPESTAPGAVEMTRAIATSRAIFAYCHKNAMDKHSRITYGTLAIRYDGERSSEGWTFMAEGTLASKVFEACVQKRIEPRLTRRAARLAAPTPGDTWTLKFVGRKELEPRYLRSR